MLSSSFKLYLYGIEIFGGVGRQTSLRVQIVPLWNWNTRIRQLVWTKWSSNCTFMELKWEALETMRNSIAGSNCTFMELKLQQMIWRFGWFGFKLYLYGIEIGRRTSCSFEPGKFKLYLYGIEIGIGSLNKASTIVLIVPLWNWNRRFYAVSAKPSACSNCTFMELKYLMENSTRHIFTVLIVPLWNWNCILMYLMSNVMSSNCTFMELKYNF